MTTGSSHDSELKEKSWAPGAVSEGSPEPAHASASAPAPAAAVDPETRATENKKPTEAHPLIAAFDKSKPPVVVKGHRLAVFFDGSADSEKALRMAVEDKTDNDILFLVTVIEQYNLAVLRAAGVDSSAEAWQACLDSNQAMTNSAAHTLQARAESLHSQGVTGLYLCVPFGTDSAKVQAVEFATERHIDVAYVGCRGLGAVKLKRTFLGSFSDYLAQAIPCKVVIVK